MFKCGSICKPCSLWRQHSSHPQVTKINHITMEPTQVAKTELNLLADTLVKWTQG